MMKMVDIDWVNPVHMKIDLTSLTFLLIMSGYQPICQYIITKEEQCFIQTNDE